MNPLLCVRSILILPSFAGVLVLTTLAGADETAAGWPTESLTLSGGRVIAGVTVAADTASIDFAEVVRPPGRPMFVVIRRIPREQIDDWRRLSAEQRQVSLEQLARFRDRVRIEQVNMESVELSRKTFEGLDCSQHENAWFTLLSTADPETTRRCVVRIDQMFRAYRQFFPPRQSNRPLRILLLDSLEQYGDYLAKHGLQVQNPAFYSQKQNLIVAASEVGDFGTRLAEVRKRHAEQVVLLERQDREFLARFESLRAELQSAGFKPDEITFEKTARLRSWNAQRDRQLKKIATADRRNESRFQELTERMFCTLNHEAFHAYIENFVYPQRSNPLPRWYEEGLAQVFESGQLEAGLLRIDAPDPARLQRLQADFERQPRLSVLQLISTRPGDFVEAHQRQQADRYYLHAWALTYYLTFIAPRTPAEIDGYALDTRSPADRLAAFAEMPLGRLESAWRQALLKLANEPAARAE